MFLWFSCIFLIAYRSSLLFCVSMPSDGDRAVLDCRPGWVAAICYLIVMYNKKDDEIITAILVFVSREASHGCTNSPTWRPMSPTPARSSPRVGLPSPITRRRWVLYAEPHHKEKVSTLRQAPSQGEGEYSPSSPITRRSWLVSSYSVTTLR